MKNRKILKALAAVSVGAVMVAGSFGLAACGGGHTHTWKDEWKYDANGHWHECVDDDGGESIHEGHTSSTSCDTCGWTSGSVTPAPTEHNHSYTWVDNGDGTHTGTCANTDNKCTEVTVSNEAHDTAGADGACSKCKYKPSGETPVTKQDEVYSCATVSADVAADTVLIEGIVKVVGGTLKYGSSTRTVKYPGLTDGSAQIGSRVQFADGATRLEVTLSEDATVLVYATGSNGTTEGKLALYETAEAKTSEFIAGTEQSIGLGGGSDIGVAAFALKAGETRYIGRSTGNSVNMFYIVISYKALSDETKTEVPAADPTCVVAGNDKYYTTNYGRYFAADGTTIKAAFEVIGTKAALNHNYNSFEIVKTPTETEGGSATIKCANDATHTVPVSLPKLTSDKYTKSGESGTVTYTFANETPQINITFEAQYYSAEVKNVAYETFNVSTLATESSNQNDKKYYDGTVFSISAITKGTTTVTNCVAKSTAVKESVFTGLSAASPDETTLNFSKGILPSGSGGVYTITNKSANSITLTVYYTSGAKAFNPADNSTGAEMIATDKTCYVIGSGNEVQTDSYDKEVKNAAVQSVTITLAAGETCTIYSAKGEAASTRCILFGVVAEYPKTTA